MPKTTRPTVFICTHDESAYGSTVAGVAGTLELAFEKCKDFCDNIGADVPSPDACEFYEAKKITVSVVTKISIVKGG